MSAPCTVACCTKSPSRGGTLIIAQISIASHIAGTISAFAMKSQRMRCGEISMKGNCTGG